MPSHDGHSAEGGGKGEASRAPHLSDTCGEAGEALGVLVEERAASFFDVLLLFFRSPRDLRS